ncbi:DUF2878 family protein [Patescibacteria group bacterium]|nr:DUF2878 family protein [Patescibacteria group bacterium]
MTRKIRNIFLNAIPVLLMIGLIPIVKDDYLLAATYFFIILISFAIKKEEKDLLVFVFGLVVLTISESLFVSTGVETFTSKTLLGLMPIWLPILWGYAFVAIKRSLKIISE